MQGRGPTNSSNFSIIKPKTKKHISIFFSFYFEFWLFERWKKQKFFLKYIKHNFSPFQMFQINILYKLSTSPISHRFCTNQNIDLHKALASLSHNHKYTSHNHKYTSNVYHILFCRRSLRKTPTTSFFL